MSSFSKLKPKFIKFIGDIPQNMCLCIYHSNFIQSVNALHKYVKNIPDYGSDFFKLFLCENSTKDCWFGNCTNCTGVSKVKIEELCNENPSAINNFVKWFTWEKDKQTNMKFKFFKLYFEFKLMHKNVKSIVKE